MKLTALYDRVTNQIIADLEAGTAPWTKPWKWKKGNGGGFLPYNYSTGRTYNGINIPILWGDADQDRPKFHPEIGSQCASEDTAIVRSIIAMGRNLGLDVFAGALRHQRKPNS